MHGSTGRGRLDTYRTIILRLWDIPIPIPIPLRPDGRNGWHPAGVGGESARQADAIVLGIWRLGQATAKTLRRDQTQQSRGVIPRRWLVAAKTKVIHAVAGGIRKRHDEMSLQMTEEED